MAYLSIVISAHIKTTIIKHLDGKNPENSLSSIATNPHLVDNQVNISQFNNEKAI